MKKLKLNTFEFWFWACAFLVFGFCTVAVSLQPKLKQADFELSVTKILTCDQSTNQCRVEFNNGWRHTLTQPIAIGDKVLYTKTWEPTNPNYAVRYSYDGRVNR